MDKELIDFLSSNIASGSENVEKIASLFESGFSPSFIIRFHKSEAGKFDLQTLRNMRRRYQQFHALAAMKGQFLKNLEDSGKKIDERLKKIISGTKDEIVLQDVFDSALKNIEIIEKRDKISELAEVIFYQRKLPCDKMEYLRNFYDPELGIDSAEKAIDKAHKTLVALFTASYTARSCLRDRLMKFADFESCCQRNFFGKNTQYEEFYNFSKKIKDLSADEYFIIKRGEKQRVLFIRIFLHEGSAIKNLEELLIKNDKHPFIAEYRKALAESYRNHLFPEMRCLALKLIHRRMENQIISDVCDKLRAIIQTPCIGKQSVISIFPLLKSGSKLVIVNGSGELIDSMTIHPFFSENRAAEAKSLIIDIMKQYKIKHIIIVGENGAIEMEKFISDLLNSSKQDGVCSFIADRHISSLYPKTAVAEKELPHVDEFIRYAVSSARKLQDILSEIAKVELADIKLNGFQNEVNKEKLLAEMREVVSEAVAERGANINSDHALLISYIPGMNKELAENAKKQIEAFGPYKSRSDFKHIPKMTPQILAEMAGFIFISDSANPLDSTFIHPEKYYIVKKISETLVIPVSELPKNKNLLKIDAHALVDEKTDIAAVRYILDELKEPSIGRLSSEFKVAGFKYPIKDFAELKPALSLSGRISNMAAFGIFIDVGIEQKALLHISELPDNHKFDNFQDFYYFGQILSVKITQLDRDKKRINLALL